MACTASRSCIKSPALLSVGINASPLAAPPFRGTVVLTVHDLSTLIVPQTEEPARVRHFAPALRMHARDAARVVTPTHAIAQQVIERLGVPAGRVRAIPHGVEPRFRPEGPSASPVPGRYVLY